MGKIAWDEAAVFAMRPSDFAHAVDFSDSRPRGQRRATAARTRKIWPSAFAHPTAALC